MCSRVSLLPGTGKTFALRVIVGLWTSLGKSVSLAAPTARAAQRMNEVHRHRTAGCVHRCHTPVPCRDVRAVTVCQMLEGQRVKAVTVHRLLEIASGRPRGDDVDALAPSDVDGPRTSASGWGWMFKRNAVTPLDVDGEGCSARRASMWSALLLFCVCGAML